MFDIKYKIYITKAIITMKDKIPVTTSFMFYASGSREWELEITH